jgi:uncharacterized protein YgfB (UPF0149 family)
MASAALMEYQHLNQVLRSLGLTQGAAEYHGILCGMLCVSDQLPENLGLEAGMPRNADAEELADAEGQVASLHDQCFEALRNPDMGFSPLLPDDDEGLGTRIDALAEWCQGFLFGLSSRPNLDLEHASPEIREAVSDLIQISRAGLEPAEDEEGEEADEESYSELLEYVRTAVQMVFLEFHTGGPLQGGPAGNATVH